MKQIRSINRPVLLALALLLLASPLVTAHAPNQSYLFLTIADEQIEGRVEISSADLNRVLDLQLAETTPPTPENIERHKSAILKYVFSRLNLTVDEQPLKFSFTHFDQLNVEFAKYVLINFTLNELDAPAKNLSIENSLVFDVNPDHRSLLVIENNWKTGTIENEAIVSLSFGPGTEKQSLNLREGSTLQGLWGFIKQGMHHIWIGADHILFLLALLLPCVMVRELGGWRPAERFSTVMFNVIKVVTVFTIAHSITLTAAALGLAELNSRLVESIIALSIAAAAIYVIWPKFSAHSFWVVLLFGLFHGFGFASVMSELWIPEKYLVWSLLGFNIGVEIGQLAIVALVVPILFAMRRTRLYGKILMPMLAFMLIAISFYWFTERALDVDFSVRQQIFSWFSS